MESVIVQVADLAGTFIFAVTGAVKGVRKRLDIFGVTVLACCVGVGGGIIRDLMIGVHPVSALKNEYYLLLCIISGAAIFATAKYWMRLRNIIQLGDAFGLGVFTFLGAQRAFEAGLENTGIILCGVVTAIGGGIIRDVLSGTVPVVLKSDFYATASVIGGILFGILVNHDVHVSICFPVVAGVVIALRMLALHYKIQLPASGYIRHEKTKMPEKCRKG